MARVIDLNPVIRITTGAIGKPGKRVFYLQAEGESRRISLICEKQQVQALGVGLQEFLQDLQQRHPHLLSPSGSYLDADMELQEPVEPLFRVSQFGLGYDEESDRVILVAQEQSDDEATEDSVTVRFWATPPVHGVLRPRVVHPAAFTFKLPANISFAEGAMVEPLAVGMHAAAKARPIKTRPVRGHPVKGRRR